MAGKTLRKEVRKGKEAKVGRQLEFGLPPAEEKTTFVHCEVPASLKWRVKLHLMKLESEGQRTTMTAWVTSLIESELNRMGR